MNNPNLPPDDSQTVSVTTELEEAAPRSYIAAGVVAALAIVLLCLAGAIIIGNATLAARQSPTPVPGSTAHVDVVGVIAPDTPFAVSGQNFDPNEKVEIYVAFAPGASFDQFVKIGEAQSGTDGSFTLAGLGLPPDAGSTVYLLGRGATSGFTAVTPVTLGGVVPVPTATMPPVIQTGTVTSATPLPPSPTTASTTAPSPTTPPTPPPPSPTTIPVAPSNTPSPSPTPDPNAVGVWFGKYYDNRDLAEPPTFTRVDSKLSFDWKSGSPGPGIPNDNFSVSWTSNQDFKTTDNYLFTLTVDDGARVYIDGNLIINEWRNGGSRTATASVGVPKGVHVIRVDYYEATGNALVSLTWGVSYTGWMGRYYNSPNLDGALVLKRDDVTAGDPFINFDWGFGAPSVEVNPDNFSVDWTRSLNFPIAATYVFTADVDDGVRVIIDGSSTPVIDNFMTTGSRVITGAVALSAGVHAIEVQYVERTGQAHLRLSWEALPPPIPPSPTTPPTPTPTTTTAPVTPVPPSPTTPPTSTTAPPSATTSPTPTASDTPTTVPPTATDTVPAPSVTPTLTETPTVTATP